MLTATDISKNLSWRGERRKIIETTDEVISQMNYCEHIAAILPVEPGPRECTDCIKTGDLWVHLRWCRSCGYVGCCDNSVNKHATKHFNTSRHPIIESYEPGEQWGFCYVDDMFFPSLPDA